MNGRITFKYGKLGEVIENIRTFALPFEIMMNRRRTYRPQPAQISADSLRAGPCDTRDPRRFPCDPRRHSPPAHPILNSSFLILNWTYTFSAKERDPETGLSYFGSRYYSSDLSIWLSVDPMSDKYPSLSPYVYCADNPVKLVDPDGEEIVEDKPPGKLAELLRSWDRAVSGSAENRQFEGGGDGANAGTMTKHDVDVAVAVGATMLSGGAALGAETAVGATFAIVSTVNNIDDATVNSAGQTVSQRATANNEGASNAVTGLKTAVSVISVGVSGNNVRKVFKEAKNEGTKVIKKNVSTFARNVADVATNLYGAVTSLFRKK